MSAVQSRYDGGSITTAHERHDGGSTPVFQSWQFVLTLGYLATCLSSVIWHSTYWHYFGLSYIQYTSITSLFLGALGQGFLIMIVAYLLVIGFQFYILQRLGASALFNTIIAVFVGAFMVLAPAFNGNVMACANARGAVMAPIGIMRDAQGRDLIPLPSSQEYLLYIRQTGDLPTIVKRDTLSLTATGRSWGVMRERGSWIDQNMWQCSQQSFHGTWRALIPFVWV